MPPWVTSWSMCQGGLRANVLESQRGLRANVAKACQLLIFTFQRVIWLAIFFILECQRANKGAKFFKHFCYQVLRKISILYYYIKKLYILLDIILIHIICMCIVNKKLHYNLSLHWCHIKEKWVEFFFFYYFFLFCSLAINQNIKRPGFYTLKLTRVFWNFPQLKELSKIKNTCQYCGLRKMWSAWVGDPR